MTKTKTPREFWLLCNLEADRGIDEKALVYLHKPNHPAISGTAIHCREVLPDDEFATYISDLIKTRSETFDELERTKKALAKAKEFIDNTIDHPGNMLDELEAIERGDISYGFDSETRIIEIASEKYDNATTKLFQKEIEQLKAERDCYRSALNDCHDEQNNDFMTSETEDGEKETWINSDAIRNIVSEALAKYEREKK